MKTDKEKELDDIFRGGLENPDRNANFRESDWDAMEAMLDKNKKRAGIIYWLPIIGSIAAMLLLALGWVLLRHNSEPVIVKNAPVKQAIHNGQNQPKNQSKVQQQTASVKPAIKATNTFGADVPNVNTHNNAAETTTTGLATGQYTANNPTKGYHKGVTVSSRFVGGSADHTTGADNAAINTQQLTAYTPAISLQGSNSATFANVILPDMAKPEIVSAPAKYKKTIKMATSSRPQFAITVLASPDINGVNSFQNSKVGTNVGFLFSLGVSKKFIISTGALYSKKPYLTDFENYHTGYKFKTDPESVSADCRVLDIPINVDYLVYNKHNNKFSIGSGLSSYIMLRENYYYNYSTPYTAGPTEYDVVNKNKHFLGVLNLDASYSRKLNSKFSLGVEPYLKIPLTDIGASQVKLQSTGVAVGITWNINSPPKP